MNCCRGELLSCLGALSSVIPLFSPLWGTREGRGDVATLIYPHHGDLEKAGVMTLTARQQSCNDVHGWYRARIEHLSGRLWHWGLLRKMWCGGPNELDQSVRVLLHFTQFCIRSGSVTHLMGHGTMSRLMFGLIKATQPPRKMRERMRQMSMCYAVKSAPPSQFVVSARSIIVKNVLMPTLVGNKLFIRQYMMDTR